MQSFASLLGLRIRKYARLEQNYWTLSPNQDYVLSKDIDTQYPIHYKVAMNQKTKISWLWVILSLTAACQAAPTPIPSATRTATIGPTPTSTPSPTTTPFPTPVPLIRIDTGDEALFFGDYDKAREEYLSAYNAATDRSVQAAALWGLGRTELDANRYELAIETLTTLTVDYSASTYSARAYFLLGRAYASLAQFQHSADA